MSSTHHSRSKNPPKRHIASPSESLYCFLIAVVKLQTKAPIWLLNVDYSLLHLMMGPYQVFRRQDEKFKWFRCWAMPRRCVMARWRVELSRSSRRQRKMKSFHPFVGSLTTSSIKQSKARKNFSNLPVIGLLSVCNNRAHELLTTLTGDLAARGRCLLSIVAHPPAEVHQAIAINV